MDPIQNPYSPGLSIPPPVLAGRDAILSQARQLLGRLKAGHGEKSLLLSGLRGSGKSSLLQALARLAADEGCVGRSLTLESGQGFTEALAQAVVAEPKAGFLLVDEAQRLSGAELSQLLRVQEGFLLRQETRALILAGLPLQEQLDDASHALAARLFHHHELTALSAEEANRALQAPAEALGVRWEADALREAYRSSKGYPVFLQAAAYEAWIHAEGALIRRADVSAASEALTQRLDRDFYGPGFERLSPRERAYLRSMAHLGPGPMRSSDIADNMDAKITSLGPLRAKLLAKGWVFSPQHGWMAFSSPGMDEYMRRVMPNFL